MGIDMTFCELREKDVVNIADGKKLGRIIDMALNRCGKIIGVIVPSEKRFLRQITSGDSIFIPWQNICKIGDDVILVELSVQTKGVANDELPRFPCNS